MHLDNSACNLASLNLLKFLDDDGPFDVEGFQSAMEVVFTAQEILVGNADYPTKSIGETSRRFRQLGIGYANLGALLMALGVPYDSDEGRAWASAITALMTGHAYATSARTAARMGPFAGYTENREPMLRRAPHAPRRVATIDDELVPADLLAAAQRVVGRRGRAGPPLRRAQLAGHRARAHRLPGRRLAGPHCRGLVRLARSATPTGPSGRTSASTSPPTRAPSPPASSTSTARSRWSSVRTARATASRARPSTG